MQVWHVLRIRTAEGDEWEPACQFMLSPLLAIRTAKLLADFLHGKPAAQADAPQWALDIRDAIRDEGSDPAACAVEVNRGNTGRRKRVARFAPSAAEPSAVRSQRRRRVG